MKKIYLSIITLLSLTALNVSCNQPAEKEKTEASQEKEPGEDGYDGPMERSLLEIEMTKDPALGYVPTERLFLAMDRTEVMRQTPAANALGLIWTERGPIYDSVGPSNGNGRGGGGGSTNPNTYTSGRMRAILVDRSDATGNTVLVGGVGGGLWRTTNFLSSIPLWQNINDFFDNLAISSICQDTANPGTMYFSTGEPTSNADAIFGKGIWKSTDYGLSWSLLPATAGFTRTFKVICDGAGNIYVALRLGGIRRSMDGGSTWTDISPTGYAADHVTDIEIGSTGTLHASFGYTYAATGGAATVRYSTSPTTVTDATWSTPAGLPTGTNNRIEMAASGNIVYLAAVNSSNNIYASFKSVDDGVTYTRQNASDYTSFTSTQAWYDISLAINPDNTSEILLGQLDVYRSANSGSSVSRMTYWVSSPPYVHADQHFALMMTVGSENRIILGSDGGIFYSNNNGTSFIDKNRNLGLKQFYSCAIHPTLTNFYLAGAQDNGTHRITQPGLTYSFEVTGGDGAFVDIDQDEPQFQFGAYVYNQYKRSINGGTNWSNFYFSNSAGLFINPFDYDDTRNKLYASYGTTLLRWNNPTTATSVVNSSRDILSIPGATGNLTSLLSSPTTDDRLYVGTSTGKLYKIDNASTITSATIAANTTEITGPGFTGFLNCIATGDTDQDMMAIFTNYGVNNVFHSADGGNTWTAIDGDLPDMPVRWAVFAPGHRDKLIIATQAGVFVARSLNGGSTNWLPSPEFPMVKTNMLKVRKSDGMILAATHGRGLWSGYIVNVLPVKDIVLKATPVNGYSQLSWTQTGAGNSTRFTIQYSLNGVSFTNIASVNHPVSTFSHQLSSPVGYYRIVGEEPNATSVYSNTVVVRSGKTAAGLSLRVSPNPMTSTGNFVASSKTAGNYTWVMTDMQGRTLQHGKGHLTAGASINLPVQVASLSRGSYNILLLQEGHKVSSTFIRQ